MGNRIYKPSNTARTDETIGILHFVYEKDTVSNGVLQTSSDYTLSLVVQGEGRLHTSCGAFGLEPGTVFFTYSAMPYCLENIHDLQYLCIRFTGLRAIALLERLPVSYAAPVVYDMGHFIKLWSDAFDICKEQNADLICEGLLLYTLAHLCMDGSKEAHTTKPSGILLAKQYVDASYTDPKLDLQSVSKRFSYDPKYFSSAFKRTVQIGFSDYLRDLRTGHAVTLIRSGITNVSDLAELCGYSDPFYFSKSFKKKFGLSPKKWMAKLEKPK